MLPKLSIPPERKQRNCKRSALQRPGASELGRLFLSFVGYRLKPKKIKGGAVGMCILRADAFCGVGKPCFASGKRHAKRRYAELAVFVSVY